MFTKTMKKNINEGDEKSGAMKLLIFGASLGGLAAAYFFLSPKHKKNLENAKSWVIKMKGDVVEKIEQAREITEVAYNKIIDAVALKYEKELKSNPEEVKALADDLKKDWEAISRSAKAKKTETAKKESKKTKKGNL